MRYLRIGTTTALLAFLGMAPAAEQPSPAPHAREALSFFAGNWTIAGSEAAYRETCEWAGTALLCRNEEKSDSGVSTTISVYGYINAEQVYTHTDSFGSSAPRVLRGVQRDGKWIFWGERTQGVKSQRWQVTILPTAKGFTFTQEVSENGTPWAINAQIEYLRLP